MQKPWIGAETKSFGVGVAWFTRDQWHILKQVADDADGLHDTYEEWLADATKMLDVCLERGLNAHRVNVIVFELVQWCRSKGIPINGASRSEYASTKLKEGDYE